MKKSVLVFCIMVFFIPSLFSFPLKNLQLGTGNDWYTLGLGDNLDDGLSFGGHVWATAQNDLDFHLDLLGYTDRLESQLRYDEVQVTGRYPLRFEYLPFVFSLIGQAGFILEGNLSFAFMQNSFHKAINRIPVNLTYEKEAFDAHLFLGGTFTGEVPFSWGDFGLEISYLHTFDWESKLQMLAVFHLSEALSLKGGYTLMTDYAEGVAHRKMLSCFTGPTFAYSFDGGLFFNSWVYHQKSGASYGIFGIDVMDLFQSRQFKKKDFTYSMGFFYDMQGQQNRSFSLTNDRLIVEIRHKNGPLFNAMDEQGKRMNIASCMVGYSQKLFTSEMVHPYVKVMGGFERFNFEVNYTTKIESTLPVLGIEGGVQLGRSGLWVTGFESYRPRLMASLHYVFCTGSLPVVDEDFAAHTGPWILMFGFAIDIEHDNGTTK